MRTRDNRKSTHQLNPNESTRWQTTKGEGGVNAAFLQEIKDENTQLQQTQRSLDELAESNASLSMFAEMLGQYRDQLAWHFAMEEKLGYLDEAIDVAPRLCREAQRLRNEHGTLYEELSNIADVAIELCYHAPEGRSEAFGAIRRQYFQFASRLKRHNMSEEDLIIDALYFDIGGGD